MKLPGDVIMTKNGWSFTYYSFGECLQSIKTFSSASLAKYVMRAECGIAPRMTLTRVPDSDTEYEMEYASENKLFRYILTDGACWMYYAGNDILGASFSVDELEKTFNLDLV